MAKKKNIQNKRFKLIIVAICSIAFIEGVALLNGINGLVLQTAIATIVGLVALVIPTPKFLKM